MRTDYKIAIVTMPLVIAFTAWMLYARLWVFEPRRVTFTHSVFWQFTVAFGLINAASVWVFAASLLPPRRCCHVVAGVAALWPVIGFSLLMLPVRFMSSGLFVQGTCVAFAAAAIALIFGNGKHQWRLSAYGVASVLVFYGAAHWYVFYMLRGHFPR